MLAVVVLVACVSWHSALSASPIVDTGHGTVSGVVEVSRNGTPYYAFRSIPYAKPPTGPRRFAKPEPAEWSGVVDASNDAPFCVQASSVVDYNQFTGQEDCLYLAVFTPSLNKTSRLPVFVFIHGGSFNQGTGPIRYGPEYFLDHPVIVVTINYRLGALGFLSVGEDWLPSNLGLWDQLEALRWVNSNILNFGGDPDKVTLGGQSAGSISTHFLITSLRADGLIKQGIMMSATADAYWAWVKASKARRNGLKALRILGCPDHPATATLTCLRAAQPGQFISLLANYPDWSVESLMTFRPFEDSSSAEGFFNPSARKRNNWKPLLMGTTQDEGASLLAGIQALNNSKELFNELNMNFNKNAPMAYLYGDAGDRPEISRQIRNFYFGRNQIKPGINLTNLYGDTFIYTGDDVTAKKYKGRLYRYKLVDRPVESGTNLDGQSVIPGVYGAAHEDDLIYLFNQTRVLPQSTLTPEEIPLSELMVKYWTNFIISGEPSEDDVWPASRRREMTFTKEDSSMRPVQCDKRSFFRRMIRREIIHH